MGPGQVWGLVKYGVGPGQVWGLVKSVWALGLVKSGAWSSLGLISIPLSSFFSSLLFSYLLFWSCLVFLVFLSSFLACLVRCCRGTGIHLIFGRAIESSRVESHETSDTRVSSIVPTGLNEDVA